MNSLLFSMPGTPIVYYGDEIGMGDNIYLGDRNGVRTPMQWTSDRNGGFSRCDPARLYLPTIMDPIYGHQAVNVEAQQRSQSSFLSWMKRLIAVRRSNVAFGRGSLSFIRPANRKVLAYVRQYGADTILCVANLSRSSQAGELDLRPFKGCIPLEMLGQGMFPPIGEDPYVITLAPYGFFWCLLRERPESTPEPVNSSREFVTVVWPDGWRTLAGGRGRQALERDALPQFLLERRWFADKAFGAPTVSLDSIVPIEHDGANPAAIALASVGAPGRPQTRYLLPLAVRWARLDRLADPLTHAVAAVRRGAREGTLLDAATEPDFVALLLRAIHAGRQIEQDGALIQCTPTAAFRQMPEPAIENVVAPRAEQSNTTVIVNGSYVVKILRKLNEGIHPEIEVGRFLVEETQYRNAPDLLGSIELIEGERRSALAVAHRFVENQGDAWTVTAAYLARFIDDQRVMSAEATDENPELIAYLERMKHIGRRTGELQSALASRPDIPEFAPEPIGPADMAAWTENLLRRSTDTLDLLIRKRDALAESDRALIDRIQESGGAVAAYIRNLLPAHVAAMRIRHHGDFHLGQVLVAKDDAYILDFEGEPGRTLEERRAKAPAARDVAGLIRSIDYSTTAALFNAINLTPDERAILTPKLEHWKSRATEAFWTACRDATDPSLWPADPAEAAAVLDFFLLEKAFYEMEYELMNRPAWLNVPLDGMWRILSRHGVVQS
jgi:maltose alpha-D-glucosyltransferase / alpha-amylase